MQTQQCILKYYSLGIADTEQLVFILHKEPGNLYYVFLFFFSPFRIPDTLAFFKHLLKFLRFQLLGISPFA